MQLELVRTEGISSCGLSLICLNYGICSYSLGLKDSFTLEFPPSLSREVLVVKVTMVLLEILVPMACQESLGLVVTLDRLEVKAHWDILAHLAALGQRENQDQRALQGLMERMEMWEFPDHLDLQ